MVVSSISSSSGGRAGASATRRLARLVASGLCGLLATSVAIGSAPGAATGAVTSSATHTAPSGAAIGLRDLPTLRQAKRLFPKVTRRDRQGYSGASTSFPRCADGGVEPGADPGHLWTASYYRPNAGKRVLTPYVELYEFSSQEQAELVMARLNEHVSTCAGLHTGVEDYSRFTPVPAPSTLGDDRIAFMWSQAYEFESGVNRSHQVWARVGNIVAVTSASRRKGTIPTAPTNAFARIVVSRAG